MQVCCHWRSTTCGLMMAVPLVLALAGCGGDGGPKTYPVSGKVVYKGTDKPVPAGEIMFESSAGETKVMASGEIGADGTFTLGSDLGKPGTIAGDHRVMLMPPMAEPGVPSPIPQRYASFDGAKIQVKIPDGGQTDLKIEIDAK